MFACVRAFGQTGGNPVLAILQGVRDFELRRKYPQPAKAFAGVPMIQSRAKDSICPQSATIIDSCP